LVTKKWLRDLYFNNLHDFGILIGISRLMCHFEEDEIFPEGKEIALHALNHEDNEMKDLGIRAFENWVSLDSLHILKGCKFEDDYLQRYVDEVIDDIIVQLDEMIIKF